MIGLSEPPSRFTCSRAGCSATAHHEIRWRNPAIHAPDRVKVWLGCDEHVGYLSEFLSARDFPVSVVALQPPDAPTTPAVPDAAAESGDGSHAVQAAGTPS